MAHPRRATGRLPHSGKRFRKKVIERLAVLNALTKELRLAAQLLIIHSAEARLKLVDVRGDALVLLEVLVGSSGEQFGEKVRHGQSSILVDGR